MSKKPIDTPYVVTTYDLIDRKATPPTVKPGHEYSRHKAENAARRAAMKAPRSCVMDGPKSIAVLTGPDGFTPEAYWKGGSASQRGGTITLGLVPLRHRGGFTVIDQAPDAD